MKSKLLIKSVNSWFGEYANYHERLIYYFDTLLRHSGLSTKKEGLSPLALHVNEIYIFGFCLCQSVTCWYAWATFRMVSSANGFPITCNPMGSPSAKPPGTVIAGTPAMLMGMVKISERYI